MTGVSSHVSSDIHDPSYNRQAHFQWGQNSISYVREAKSEDENWQVWSYILGSGSVSDN